MSLLEVIILITSILIYLYCGYKSFFSKHSNELEFVFFWVATVSIVVVPLLAMLFEYLDNIRIS